MEKPIKFNCSCSQHFPKGKFEHSLHKPWKMVVTSKYVKLRGFVLVEARKELQNTEDVKIDRRTVTNKDQDVGHSRNKSWLYSKTSQAAP